MAVYNGAAYLVDAIDSILGQTFGDFQFLILDDCSCDKTPAVLSDLAARDPRIRVERNSENLGQTPTLNRGLDLVETEYVARMDADDLSAPERLARQIGFLDVNPECVLLGTGARDIDSRGERT